MQLLSLSPTHPVRGGSGFDQVGSRIPHFADKLLDQNPTSSPLLNEVI